MTMTMTMYVCMYVCVYVCIYVGDRPHAVGGPVPTQGAPMPMALLIYGEGCAHNGWSPEWGGSPDIDVHVATEE